MARLIQVWESNDGKRFDTEADAIAHETNIAKDGDINTFLKESGKTGRSNAAARNIIRAWEAWEAQR